MNYNRPELLDKLAAEYALGTLAGAARKRFERVLRELPAARDAVARWNETLHPLAAALPPEAPPAHVWKRIEARLPGSAAQSSRSGWRSWFAPALSMAFGFVLALGLVQLQPLDSPPAQVDVATPVMPESYVGLLTDATGKPAVLAASRRHGRELFVKLLQPVAVPPGKTLTLWALPKSGVPFRVGALPGDGKVTLALPAESETLFKNVPRLAATLEPASNVPLTPSESYLLIGSCVKLW